MSDERQRMIELVKAALREVGLNPEVTIDEERGVLRIQPMSESQVEVARRVAVIVNQSLGRMLKPEAVVWRPA